jgi:two-component system, NtrC family, nitrogen regulation sensor histidine kinase NtrY
MERRVIPAKGVFVRMNRLRNRLIAVFIAATLLPLGLTLWVAQSLLQTSLDFAPLKQMDALSETLKSTGRELYLRVRDELKRDAQSAAAKPEHLKPSEAQAFWDRAEPEAFELGGDNQNRLDYYVRGKDEVLRYSRPMGVSMTDLTREYAESRQLLEQSGSRNIRRGFSWALFVVAGTLWCLSLAALVYLAHRVSEPVRALTEGLGKVAAGNLSTRVKERGSGEVEAAVQAFNHMAEQLEMARNRLILVTRLSSWQAVARKMAHEVKNSLTPIRLNMEEISSRNGRVDPAFLEQASQIVADEVNTLERRVRAFSEFASEPPVMPAEIDVNALVEERVAFLRSAHPEVGYELRLEPEVPAASADADLIKGVLTNLLENAAQAAGPGGRVMAKTSNLGDYRGIEVHDTGPGLSAQARASLFEPTISFKKGGMGLGLSIARRSALLCGGDLEEISGELGGAGFRVMLPAP